MSTQAKAQEGTWTLIAPDGRKWEAASPLKVAAAEQRERVPPRVALDRIFAARDECEDATQRAINTLKMVAIGLQGGQITAPKVEMLLADGPKVVPMFDLVVAAIKGLEGQP